MKYTDTPRTERFSMTEASREATAWRQRKAEANSGHERNLPFLRSPNDYGVDYSSRVWQTEMHYGMPVDFVKERE